MKGSCACTVPKLAKNVLEPGDSTVVAITFNSAKRPGKVNTTVTVTSNDPDLILPDIVPDAGSDRASIGSLLPIPSATGAGALLYSVSSGTGAVLIMASTPDETPVSIVIPGGLDASQEDLTATSAAQTTLVAPR